jgi:hypothetical protein
MINNVYVGLFIVIALFLCLNLFILNNIQNALEQPYMDEIFHIPQAKHYCNGNYTEVIALFFLFILYTINIIVCKDIERDWPSTSQKYFYMSTGYCMICCPSIEVSCQEKLKVLSQAK